MAKNTGRFRIETEREHLSALFGLWVGLWSVLLILGGTMLVHGILNVLAGQWIAIGGMVSYVFLLFVILWTKTKRLIYRLASAMVEMEMKSCAQKKAPEEKGDE